ncbi:uncharacterized protein B0I36DRAFT_227459, partial [Microdochium trichocladiopsis]
VAGTGKTTIARTIAQHYHELERLGASFFFSRNTGGDLVSTNKFASAIAAQLADHIPALKPSVTRANTSSRLRHLGLFEQWKKLVLEPLATLDVTLKSSIVFMVDALDECADEEEIRLLIHCLAGAVTVQGVRLRVFVTS